MNIGESIRVAWRALGANKLRSALTMLGIVIGVAAVIALMAAGQGVQVFVTEQFQGIGSNLLFVLPNVGRFGPGGHSLGSVRMLTMRDAQALSDPLRAPDVAQVAPELDRDAVVTAGGRRIETSVQGVTPAFVRVRKWKPMAGNFITTQDMEGRSRVVVLGKTVAETLFPDNPLPIGETVRINNTPFRVIGIMEEKGGTFTDQDNTVFVPLTTAQSRLFYARAPNGEYRVSYILVEAVSEDRMDAAAEQIRTILRERHHIAFEDEDDFIVLSQADLIQTFGNITNVLTIFLGAIAGISLLVGGIGIMNIMLVSVTERTREIGLRKAVGARRRDILMQFLVEAVTLAVTGGMVGVGIGFLGAQIITALVKDFRSVVTPQAVLLATAVSAAVGLASGLYPAWRASRLNPIEALRYE